MVEIGGTSVKIGFGVDGRPSDFTRTFATQRIRTADPAADLATLVIEACTTAGLSPTAVVATVPGFLDHDFDTVLHAKNVPELEGHRLATELSKALRCPVQLERDVVLQLLGEARAGAVRGRTEILAVYIGTGIGAAYLGEHGIFRGGGWALEIGHIPWRPASPGEIPASLETHASGAALASLSAEFEIDVGSVFLQTGIPTLSQALAILIRDQAIAIATALALFSPRRLLIGGGVVDMPGYPREALASHIGACRPPGSGVRSPEIVYASLGWQAAIWGGLVLHRVDRAT
ncbi:ROK family protein [Aureimonas sp. SA4125]|uniref:ROK family protein n=1 Tax=Aureimonas sp. SA4125 TaxID=2826993 RepID=UPI001CC7EC21|nr:ROK family protein [Aureimonas sp. SA4125]